MNDSEKRIQNWKENPNAFLMLSKLIDSNQQCIDAYQMRSEVFVFLKDFESAIQDCQTLLQLEPSLENQKQLIENQNKLKIVQNIKEGKSVAL